MPVKVVPPGAGHDSAYFPHGQLTNAIIGGAFEVHNVLGPGFLESIYANALTIELRLRGVPVERNVPFEVMYRGVSVGRYVADLVVDQKVIVETKVAKAIDAVHRAQVLNYLRASGLEVGPWGVREAVNASSIAVIRRASCTERRERGWHEEMLRR